MRTEDFSTFIADAQARARETGVAAMPPERLRNRGAGRTAAKRAALANAEARARAAGIEPVPAHF